MRVGRDRRSDVLHGEVDRARLERRELRRASKDVAIELLLDAHDVTVVLCIDGVAPSAEVHEIEQREVILKLLEGNREARRNLRCVERRRALVPARGEKVSEQRLQHAEALWGDRAGGPFGQRPARIRPLRARNVGRISVVGLQEHLERSRHRLDELDRLERDRPPVLAKDPAGDQIHVREVRLEGSALDRSRVRERALHPPRRVLRHRDARSPDDLADLPRTRDPVLLDVEVRRDAEVALATRREPDVAADAGDLERARRSAVEIVADDVPVALVESKRVGIHGSLPLPHTSWAPVPEADGSLLGDRGLELRQPSRELGRVVRCAHAHALGRFRRRPGEAYAPEGKILQRKTEGLRIGELPFEVVQRGLQRGELIVLEVEALEEVIL